MDYFNATGKTKALFGITLFFNYGYRIYLGIASIILLIITLVKIYMNKRINLNYYLLIINLLSSILLLTEVWFVFMK